MRTLFTLLAVLTAHLFSTAPATADDFDYAEIKTNMGIIVLELNKTKAPISVANFEDYAKSGYYNGTVFHRVIGNFMIQGGGFDFHGDYNHLHKKPGAKPGIKNEWQNGLKNVRGSVAMARLGGQADSATNQFFINVADNDFLDSPRDGAAYAKLLMLKVIPGAGSSLETAGTRTSIGSIGIASFPLPGFHTQSRSAM